MGETLKTISLGIFVSSPLVLLFLDFIFSLLIMPKVSSLILREYLALGKPGILKIKPSIIFSIGNKFLFNSFPFDKQHFL